MCASHVFGSRRVRWLPSMTDFKVTVGVKEINVKADDLDGAVDKAMDQLVANVTSVTVTKVEPKQIGFQRRDDGAADD